ncbi:MAG: hypothetical protein IJX17_03260 [Clostridia bacterium]|nr:hypothetical protein [Clostridia bacterium]
MRKSVKIFLLFLVISVTTFVAITMWFNIQNAHDDFGEEIIIESNGQTVKNFSIDDLMLNPGQSKEYSVNLICKAEGTYLIILDYNETKDGGLKGFVDVDIFVNDNIIETKKLDELLTDNVTIEFSEDLYGDKPVVLKFVYKMSNNIKNEAQETYADFDLKLTIEKE